LRVVERNGSLNLFAFHFPDANSRVQKRWYWTSKMLTKKIALHGSCLYLKVPMQTHAEDAIISYLAAETGANTVEEKKRLLGAILKASEEFTDYFVDNPNTSTESCKRDIFILTAKIIYFESRISSTCIDRLKRDLNDRLRRLASLQQSAHIAR
jgi:hypothetical protein